jgi:hypothetical protein
MLAHWIADKEVLRFTLGRHINGKASSPIVETLPPLLVAEQFRRS